MTVPEVIQLVKAGVSDSLIMRHVRATGTRLTLAVADILKLKEAGASDALLEALMQTSTAPAADPESAAAGSLRTWRETTPEGDVVIHVTNLDEMGRRIGGELPPSAAEPHRETPAWPDRMERDEGRAPVIVNVYPPAANDGYQPAGPSYLGGRYPGYFAGLGYGFCRSCPRPHLGGLHGAAGLEAGLFSRPSAIDTRPYRSHTAAQRNRQSFGGN